MLFTTVAFACLFLPLTLILFFRIAQMSRNWAAGFLLLASLLFYGVWMPEYVILLSISIIANYAIGHRIAVNGGGTQYARPAARMWLIFGVGANLSLLGYYKYSNFFVDNVGKLLGVDFQFATVLLPIGISFFTFTQIAFLADSYLKGVREYNFAHYGLFVTYFPHLIAGPVLHHAQMMPQFQDAQTYRFNKLNFVVGMGIFAVGLLKKVVMADGISPYADAVFGPADNGFFPGFHEAWLGALAYTFQIYYDFSGYSDMAIGLSLMFNIRLPINFNSPYKARSISDFWRRWHISLSTFLRDYLYVTLGGNRHGQFRRYFNLAITMVLGGLWHGASWSFVLWGALHGAYLTINHAFRAMVGERVSAYLSSSRWFGFASWLLTMFTVVVAWVFFRAHSLGGAMNVLAGMFNVDTISVPIQKLLWTAGLQLSTGLWWCLGLGLLAALAPNSNSIGRRLASALGDRPRAQALVGGAAICAALFLVVLNTSRDAISAFIYFNF